jgi:16S rRNA processing protein RimM
MEMVTIGKITRAHGMDGEVQALSMSDVPRRFEELKRVTVADPAGGRQALTVRSARRTTGGYLLKFEGVNTVEAAASLVRGLLQIPQVERAPLSDGRYYESDLVGMEVRTEAGNVLGTIEEILRTGSNAVFVVRGAEKSEYLIPGTKEIVRTVDIHGRLMTIRQVAGLLDEGAKTNAL